MFLQNPGQVIKSRHASSIRQLKTYELPDESLNQLRLLQLQTKSQFWPENQVQSNHPKLLLLKF